ncbi:hypothetical protein HK104_009397, partial [Borealophlyctis nickersoniae]
MTSQQVIPFLVGKFYRIGDDVAQPTDIPSESQPPQIVQSPSLSSLSSSLSSLDIAPPGTVFLCVSSPAGTNDSLFLMLTSRFPLGKKNKHLHNLYYPLHPTRQPDHIYPDAIVTINPVSMDEDDRVWIYLGRTFSFREKAYSHDECRMLKNGITETELIRLRRALLKIHHVDNSRWAFTPCERDCDANGGHNYRKEDADEDEESNSDWVEDEDEEELP